MEKALTLFNFIKENQFLSTALGLSSAGLITFWIKDVPLRIYNFIKNKIILTLEIEDGTNIHKYIPGFIEDNIKKRNFHTYIMTNSGFYPDRDIVNSAIMPGSGKHFVKACNRFYILHISDKQKSNFRSSYKEQTTFNFKFYTIGLSKKPIDELSESIEKWIIHKSNSNTTPMIRKFESNMILTLSKLPKRKLDTIFMDRDNKDLLIRRIQHFYDSEQWYYEMGIPYKLGIMLYGPPGTGKSSLIKSMASYFNKNITSVSPSYIDTMANAAVYGDDDSCGQFIVVEDIDTNISGPRERTEEKYESLKDDDGYTVSTPTTVKITSSLSDILNTMDGLNTPNKFVFIMTTNHINKLDPALFRPGRIDILIELGYATYDAIQDFIDYYYPDNNVNIRDINIKNNITISKLQNFILNGDSLDNILEYCKNKEKYLEVVK